MPSALARAVRFAASVLALAAVRCALSAISARFIAGAYGLSLIIVPQFFSGLRLRDLESFWSRGSFAALRTDWISSELITDARSPFVTMWRGSV